MFKHKLKAKHIDVAGTEKSMSVDEFYSVAPDNLNYCDLGSENEVTEILKRKPSY